MATDTISVRLDRAVLKDLAAVEKEWQTDRSESLRRLLVKAISSWKVQNALEKLRQHKISIGKAAKDCGLSLWEMMDLAKEANIDWVGYSKGDLERELRILEGYAEGKS